MKLTFKGGSKRQQELVKELFNFLHKHFSIRQTTHIKVKFTIDESCSGYCIILRNNKYEIAVNRKLPVKEMLLTLIHEFTHLKQNLQNRCITECSGITYWEGKSYNIKHIDPKHPEYWIAPWEVEAFGCQTAISTWIEFNSDIYLDLLTWNNCQKLITFLKIKNSVIKACIS